MYLFMDITTMVEYQNVQTSYLRGQNTIQPEYFTDCRMFLVAHGTL